MQVSRRNFLKGLVAIVATSPAALVEAAAPTPIPSGKSVWECLEELTKFYDHKTGLTELLYGISPYDGRVPADTRCDLRSREVLGPGGWIQLSTNDGGV
jgi:hypothetical protein